MLKQDTPLKVLDLSYNRLGDDGAKYLAEALVGYNTHLTTYVILLHVLREHVKYTVSHVCMLGDRVGWRCVYACGGGLFI